MSSIGVSLDHDGPRGSRRVLVADHDPDVRAQLEQRLDAAGFAVAVATGVDDVIEMVDRTCFDAVILDPALSGHRCRDLMFFVHHRRTGTPVVLLGNAGPRSRPWGAAACLPRSTPAADLIDALEVLVPPSLAPLRPAAEAGASPAPATLAAGRGLHLVIHARRDGRLREVLDSIAPALASERIVIVGLRHDAEAIEDDVHHLGARPHVLLEPRDRGSAAAILLGAYYVRRHAPEAVIGAVSSRGTTPGPALVDTVQEAARFVERFPRWIFMLGERQSRGSVRDVWIVPASVLACSETTPVWRAQAICTTGRPPTRAQRTAAFRGTGVIVAKAARLVSGARRLLPAVHATLLQTAPLIGCPVERTAVQRAYAVMPRLDLIPALLAPALPDVAVGAPAGMAGARAAQITDRPPKPPADPIEE